MLNHRQDRLCDLPGATAKRFQIQFTYPTGRARAELGNTTTTAMCASGSAKSADLVILLSTFLLTKMATPIKTTGNFLSVGKNGERIAAFACEDDKRIYEAARDIRTASQNLYDAVQRYLKVPDCELPAELVEAMNELEAAWHKADGTIQEDTHA